MPQVPEGFRSLHDGPNYQVIFQNLRSDTVVVSFAERKEPKPADFFGRQFLTKETLSHIAVRSLENDWYLNADMDAVLAAIREGLTLLKAKRLILFGNSMGSFGCIRTAHQLRPARIIIGGPIVTLDPKLERRWLSDYRHLLPNYQRLSDQLLPLPNQTEVISIYDPKSPDAAHVRLLEDSIKLHHIQIAGAGHMVLPYLRDSGVLGDVTRLLFAETPNITAAKRLVQQSRKKNRSHLLNLAERLNSHPRRQKVVIDYALERMSEDDVVQLAYARFQSRQGNLIGGAALIRQVVSQKGSSCFGVPLAKAIAVFAQQGGAEQEIAEAVIHFSGTRPRSREMQLWYARYLRFSGAFDAAFVAHESFMGGDTFEAHAHIERGLIFEHFKLFHAARNSFKQAENLAPDYPPARHHHHRMTKLLTAIQK